MLHTHKLILELCHLALSGIQNFAQLARKMGLGRTTNTGKSSNGISKSSFQSRYCNPQLFQQWLGKPIGLFQQNLQEVLTSHLGIIIFRGELQSSIESLAKFDGEFFRAHMGMI